MKNQNHNKYLFILILLILTLTLTACGASAEKLNKHGNEAYTKQMYEEALVAYQAAQIESPELAEPYYNAANTLYRQGNYAEAIKQLSYAMNYADEETIRQSGLYNLGNNAYNSQELELALEAYKEALLIDGNDQDAKYNLELALQQQEQKEQQQENQEQNQDQRSEGEDSEENQDQNEAGDNQQDQSQSEDDPQDGDPNQDSDSSEDQADGEGQSDDQSEQHDEDNRGDQEEQNIQEQGEGQPQDQEAHNHEQDGQDGQIPAPGQRMTEEQAEQLLAAIAQDMETLQERLGQVLFVQDLPPTQDW